MSELFYCFGVVEFDYIMLFYGVIWDEGDLYCEKYIEFLMYFWCVLLDFEMGELCGENLFKYGFVFFGLVVFGICLRFFLWMLEMEKEVDCFDFVSLCYLLVENGFVVILIDF